MATLAEQPCYTLINFGNDSEIPNEMQLKDDIEHGDVCKKTASLKKLIQMAMCGEKIQPALLMYVIRFIMPRAEHALKKLLLVFWEVVSKHTPDGKLMQEMILVCDAYRKDLQHPNEFIRGSTLRFLCKLKESELIEPLMPTIRACLEHKHSYVRRNAVLAIYTIYRNHDTLIPDAPDLIADFLQQEQDASCKRNAFMMLIHVDQEKALTYLAGCLDQVHTFNDILQLVIVELIYKVCHSNPAARSRFIRCIYNLLQAPNAAVRYEAAGTLVTLTSARSAIKASAQCYIELIVKESDNNVKLIVLDRLIALKNNHAHRRILQELTMDILRVLSAPDLEVRRKTLDLSLDLVSTRNIDDMVLMLQKEVVKTNEAVEQEDAGKYRQLLVKTLHQCAVRFPKVAASVIPVLMEFLGDSNENAATDVLDFVREAMQRFTELRPVIMTKLQENFGSIKTVKTFRLALWILGEFAESSEDIQGVMTAVRMALGEIPIVEDELKKESGEAGSVDQEALSSQAGTVQRLTTADGTYVTQSAFVSTTVKKEVERPPLRKFLLAGDFFVASALSSVLTKLALRLPMVNKNAARLNSFRAEAMLVMSTIIHYGKSGMPEKPINDDDLDHIALCLNVLSEPSDMAASIFTRLCRSSLDVFILSRADEEQEFKMSSERDLIKVQADDPIQFAQLMPKNEVGQTEDMFAVTMSQALGTMGDGSGQGGGKATPSSKLNKVYQLTGFSDPVYAEAYVHVNQYDIVLDILVVNQTSSTLENMTVEMTTLGDLKLVEKPQTVTLGGKDFCNIKANIKVSSTESGIIFGSIAYEVSGAQATKACVILNDIHIDVMEYIQPATCSDAEFRQMWMDFEWENKVIVNTNITDLQEYMEHLLRATNMKCLTPEKAVSGECGFLAANLYAKSIFGEDALVNLSIEKGQSAAEVKGHIRIRGKTKGMALSLGDKISLSQKKAQPAVTAGAA